MGVLDRVVRTKLHISMSAKTLIHGQGITVQPYITELQPATQLLFLRLPILFFLLGQHRATRCRPRTRPWCIHTLCNTRLLRIAECLAEHCFPLPELICPLSSRPRRSSTRVPKIARHIRLPRPHIRTMYMYRSTEGGMGVKGWICLIATQSFCTPYHGPWACAPAVQHPAMS